MKIAIVSDIHDHYDHLKWFLAEITKLNVACIFGLGDYCSLQTIYSFATTSVPIIAVRGNCDLYANTLNISVANGIAKNFTKMMHTDIVVAQKHFYLSHYPHDAENAAQSQVYDAVFHGHTHYIRDEKINNTPIINPGKLTPRPHSLISFCIFDTATSSSTFAKRT